jgi:hypothetical protein
MPRHELAPDPLEQNLGWLVGKVVGESQEYVSRDEQPIIFIMTPGPANKAIIFHSNEVPNIDLVVGVDFLGRVYLADEEDGLKRQKCMKRAFDRLQEALDASQDSNVHHVIGVLTIHKRFDDVKVVA